MKALGTLLVFAVIAVPGVRAEPGPDEGEPIVHERRPVQPPGESARDGWRPGGPSGPEGGPPTVGEFVSIQVNIDEFSNNIPGDAANEPSMAIDPTDPNKIVIGWRQFDTVESNFRQSGYAYSHDAGQTWTFPGSLTPGIFGSDPVLGADSQGNFYYASINFDEMRLFRSFDGGVTWDDPPIQILSGFHDKEWMLVDASGSPGDGNIYLAWSDQLQFTRSTDGGATFAPPITSPITNTFWGTMDVNSDGDLFLLDRSFAVTKSSTAKDPFSPVLWDFTVPVDLGGEIQFQDPPNPVGLHGQPWIAIDRSGGANHNNIYALCSVDPPGIGGDPLEVMFARSTDGGMTWEDPVRVNDDPPMAGVSQWFGAMSVGPQGRIDATWYDMRNSPGGDFSEVYYAYSIDGGVTWSKNIPVSPPFNHTLGYPQQNKLGDYTHMISDEDGANLAYAATFNGEQDVYYLRMVPDCNGNGAHDGNDLLGGLDDDCNGNVIPDLCDVAATDLDQFVEVLLGMGDPSLACLFDLNDDGTFDGLDVQPYVDFLLGG